MIKFVSVLKSKARRNFIYSAAFSLFVLSSFWFLAFCLMQYDNDHSYHKLGLKIAEFVAQVLLVVISGGIFMQNYVRMQARKTAVNEFRKATLDTLISTYSGVKKVRRSLRSKVEMSDVEKISYGTYDAQLTTICDIQLRLEVVKRELRVFAVAFENPAPLTVCIRNMEKYLGELIGEHEQVLRCNTGASFLAISKLERTAAFIARGESGDFRKFAIHFQCSLSLLQAERIKLW